jgi:hypothetical protein
MEDISMIKGKLSNRAITNAVDNNDKPRHRWYPIKEGFSATLISDAIAEAGDGRKSSLMGLEPFSGSGTAPLQYALSGIRCLAFEVNPFLAFVGRAKLKQLSSSQFEVSRDMVLKGLGRPRISALEDYSTFSEGAGKAKWLFNRSVLRSFTGGWNSTKSMSPSARSLFQLALIRAAMDNCNAYPDGKCLRYKRLKSYDCFNREAVITRFESYSTIIKEDLKESPLPRKLARIRRLDIRKLSSFNDHSKFDVCITSPPYLNSFDYSDVYRPELFLGGFVTSNEELMRIRLQTIRSHVQASWKLPTQESFGVVYAKVFRELEEKKDELWSMKLLKMVQAYFEDMEKLLRALKSRANRDAILKIAVGTSAYAGVVIPVDLIIADIAESCGWLLKDVQVVRRLRSSAQLWNHEDSSNNVPELRESIVILRTPSS